MTITVQQPIRYALALPLAAAESASVEYFVSFLEQTVAMSMLMWI
jgi:hypothetical protein